MSQTTAKIDVATIDGAKIGELITTISESVGSKDSIAKQKSLFRVFTEKIGNFDVISKYKAVAKSISESVGNLDVINKFKDIYRTIREGVGSLERIFGTYGDLHKKKYHEAPRINIQTPPYGIINKTKIGFSKIWKLITGETPPIIEDEDD